ncbi:MAG: hypothetical protein R3B48_29745 [Kofleriaceae bacterium]
MSSIVVGYRQLEVNQLEVPKATVARFAWRLVGEHAALIAAGQTFVFGEGARVAGFQDGMEYWYVEQVGAVANPARFTVECQVLVAAEDAEAMLRAYAPEQAFVASMVPKGSRLLEGDPVLTCASVQGQFGEGAGANAALWIELEGAKIKRLDWYWDGAKPLSLFPGGAKVGQVVELHEVRNGAVGFPKIGWNKCEQLAAPN